MWFLFWLKQGHQQESGLKGQPGGNNPPLIGCFLLKGTFRGGKTQKKRLKEKMLCCATDQMKVLGSSLRSPHPKNNQFKKKSGTFAEYLHKLKVPLPFSVTKDFSLLLQEGSCSQEGFIFCVTCRVPWFWHGSSTFVTLSSPNFSDRG